MKTRKALSLLLVLCFLPGLVPALAQSAGAEEERAVSPWAVEEISRAEGYGLLDVGTLSTDYEWWGEVITDWRQPVTRAMFVRFALSYAAAMNHSDRVTFQSVVNKLLSERSGDGYFLKYPFSDDHSEEVAAAYALGIVQGRGGGVFDPNALITRQEAASMLCRAYAACGAEATELGTADPFADEEDIAPWAAEAVHILRSRNVLRGMGDGRFDPRGSFTIQQCAVCFLRLYELMPVSFLRGNVTPVFTREEAVAALETEMSGILRWDGPEAAFLRKDLTGVMHGYTAFFLAYPDGGVRRLDAAVPTRNNAPEFDAAGFSGDGKTFTYTMTLERDEYAWAEAPTLLSAAGEYTVSVDVLTGAQTVGFAPAAPREGRWDDVPEDAWYYPAVEYCCVELALIPEAAERRFAPDGAISEDQMVETLARVHSYLTTGLWSLPLRPADWGVAALRLADGREFEAFRAWETARWHTWAGPMNKEPWHYSIRVTEEELTALFPALAEQTEVWTAATLDMGDKQVPGRLCGTTEGDFEEAGPALLFYPEETSEYKDGGLLEPGAPTPLFQCAQPGDEGSHRGLYYFAEKGLFAAAEPDGTVYGWELSYFLYWMYRIGSLPEETFRPIYDVTVPEGTAWGQELEPLVRAGILRLDDPDWSFDPYGVVTRARFAVILWRLLEPEAR